MDLDCVVEKGGQVLILEFKPERAPLPLGQRLTLRTFVRLGCEVWVAWESKDGVHVEVGSLDKHGDVKFIEKMTVNKLRQRVLDWRNAAAKEGVE